MRKKVLSILTLFLIPIVAFADKSGICGDNLTWTLVESTGTLTISGSGTMNDYNYYSPAQSPTPWYDDRTKILIVVIDGYVNSIGDCAFYDCSNLTSVTIPNSVTRIGHSAFRGCSGLASIEIPNSVTFINSFAFSDCIGLTSIEIPNSVTYIGSCAFSGCSSLNTITISNRVKSIGAQTFMNCNSLTTITIPNSVTTIEDWAFFGCSGLVSITIPNSVTSIGDCVFYDCSNLESIDIPESTKTIGVSCFHGCTNLASVQIAEGVENIGDNCFEGCTNLKVLEIPGSVTSIGDYFFDDYSLNVLEVNWTSPLPTTIFYQNNGHETFLIVPLGCKSAYEADDNWNQFTEIIDDTFVAETIDGARIRYKITDEETKQCETCSYHYIPAISMSYQGRLEIPKEVGEYVVTGIGDHSFSDCDGITSVWLPNTIETIGECAFSQCDNLERVTAEFNYVLRNIGSYAFNSCPKLTDFDPSGQLQTIGDFAFAYTNISEFIMPTRIRQLGHAPFARCTNLTRFFMNPNPRYDSRDGCNAIIETSTNTLIEYLACSNSIPSSVKVIGSYAMIGDYLTSVTIPEGVECISEYGFYTCKKLETVILPKTLKKIETGAFDHCMGLTSIVIPDNVTSLGDGAFWGCSNLTNVTVYAPSCSLEAMTFMNCPSLEKIYVFNDKVSWYTTNCSTYSSKIEAITLTANEGAMGEYWATYYNNLSHAKAPSGTQVFKVALTGSSLELTEITDGIITMGEGVVLKSNTATIMPEYSETESATSYDDNDLEGTMTSIVNPGNAYVLNKKDAGVGFYKLSATGTIGANKAYLTYDGSAGARGFFSFGDATGIEMPTMKGYDTDAVVYDLQGRRVALPTKGLYIMNGKKVFINK